jgi:hypothetical protein
MIAEAALASSAAGTDVTKAAFISGALRELGVTLCVGNELVYREAMLVYAAAGGTRARMGMHVLRVSAVPWDGRTMHVRILLTCDACSVHS